MDDLEPRTGRDVSLAELAVARATLRGELEARGYSVASDTLTLRGELYVRGDHDLALALFEFKATAEEAFAAMYQGTWVDGMPPRFAVLPALEADSQGLDLLEQARVHALFFERAGADLRFPDLDSALALIGRPANRGSRR
jgi:hypothetical protein